MTVLHNAVSVQLATYASTAAVFVGLEMIIPIVAHQPRARDGWRSDLAFLVGNTAFFAAGLGSLIGVAGYSMNALVPFALLDFIRALPLWGQALLAIGLGDLGTYAVHRLEHALPVLWRFHSIHHTAESMDFLVAVRNHPIDLLMQKMGGLAPLLALGISPVALGVYGTVYFWQSFLAHANVRLPYGPLKWILVSPDFHHWHHAEEPVTYDRNFAGLCAFWDVLFGTAYMPRTKRPDRYGLCDRIPDSYWRLLCHPFREPKVKHATDGSPIRM